MYGDDPNDLFSRNTFQTGDAAFVTPKSYGAVKFAWMALDQAQREIQHRLQEPVSNGRNYESYLHVDPWNPDRHVTGLTMEDRVERRPASVTAAPTPVVGAPTPLQAMAGGYIAQIQLTATLLGLPPLKP